MPRAISPALSDNEVDISRSLVQDHGFASESESDGEEQEKDILNRKAIDFAGSDHEDDEAFIALNQAAANRKNSTTGVKKAGAFQTMGLNATLLKAITRKGFSVPTPIQRKTIPLILDSQDVVGMARTGSGKTAAFVIPMIEKLKSHSAKVGARAVVLSPSRELALQTLKVVKEMSKGIDLRTILLVGGDSLEDQFSSMAGNPDIIIATPGRFEHLKVEMNLDLSSVKYVVFDEADRLFEMGFAAQLTEIMHALPATRQTLLFSATLPKSLVEFARAGLQDPKLVRLDAETKISPGLDSAFFTVKNTEKEGALLHLLQDVIKMRTGPNNASLKEIDAGKKRKRGGESFVSKDMPSPQSTVVFAATKHHVEYLSTLLKAWGYATSYVYGSLDQTARKMQVQDFRTGQTNILIVTDVAARGLDIPVLANVINYDFTSQPKVFVHRVGRTARAGKTGWSYSLISGQDLPYLLDLQFFLGRKLVLGRAEKEADMFRKNIVVGVMLRDKLERRIEEVQKILDEDDDITAMRDVAAKGEKQYLRTRSASSTESVKRAKELAQSVGFREPNVLFDLDQESTVERERLDMLARVSGFRPQETVFEIGKRGIPSEAAGVIKNRRAKIEAKARSKRNDEDTADITNANRTSTDNMAFEGSDNGEGVVTIETGLHMEEASDSELELTSTATHSQHTTRGEDSWQDDEHFMSYTPSTMNLAEDRGYGVHSGSTINFTEAAKGASMDLTNDESKAFGEPTKARGMRWDKKSKKYVSRANDEDGSKGTKMIRGESGQKIAASFRSGRFDAWRKANRVDRLPKVGETEGNGTQFMGGVRQFKHKMERAPKEADKFRDDYHKRRKKVEAAKENRIGRFAEGKGKNELKSVDDVRKARKLKEKRRDKNARPSRRK